MKVNKEEIIHMANLASLNLSNEEIEQYTEDMQDILTFAETIEKIKTDGIDESAQVIENYNIFRKDEVIEFKDKELLLQNAPSSEGGMFHLPKVIN